MVSSIRTIEQERAKYAWQCISKVKNENFAGDYRSIALKMPSLILTNGLGQTLAFLKSKGEKEHEALLEHINNWIKRHLVIEREDILEWIIETASSQQYRLATMEVLSLLHWLKRFAEATLPKGV